jgi:hypothetical protein
VGPRRIEVVDLEHQHVAAVTTAPIDQAAGCGVGPDRRDDLQERVAEREHVVAQPEVLYARIRVRLREAESLAQLPGDRVEVASGEDRLAKPRDRGGLRHRAAIIADLASRQLSAPDAGSVDSSPQRAPRDGCVDLVLGATVGNRSIS